MQLINPLRQLSNDLHLLVILGDIRRRLTLAILDILFSAFGQKCLHYFGMAESRRIMECRVSIGVLYIRIHLEFIQEPSNQL